MSIKKLITGLTLSMLLGSGAANADWGDVYYCQMTNFNSITLEGEKENHTLEKFQFKLDQRSNAMVFGSTSWFQNQVYKLTKGRNFPSQEYWYADGNNKHSNTLFDEGKFVYMIIGTHGVYVISANCDKF